MWFPAAVAFGLALRACGDVGHRAWRSGVGTGGRPHDPRGRPALAVPPYEQLRQGVTALVLGGAVAPGARLPSIRQLAGDLGLAGGTVARAYRELEADGIVTTRVATAPWSPAPSDHARHRPSC